ncbi:hypothetical protein LINPERHAP2_LOCUS16774 [Linum perenne]
MNFCLIAWTLVWQDGRRIICFWMVESCFLLRFLTPFRVMLCR